MAVHLKKPSSTHILQHNLTMLLRARPHTSTHPMQRLEIAKARPFLFALVPSHHRTGSCSNNLKTQPRHSTSFYPGISQAKWIRSSSMTERPWTRLNHRSSVHAKAQAQYPEVSANVEGSVSIVDGLVDFLNESWTQFHATGMLQARVFM